MATAKQARSISKFDEIRSEIVEWLNMDLLIQLKPPSTVVFHEVLYAGSQVPGIKFIVENILKILKIIILFL